MKHPDPLSYFQLKPLRGARVSEISEATAAAPVPDEERVNFHIGNPLQDPRQTSAYVRVALGLDIHAEELPDTQTDALLEALRWDPADKPTLDFIIHTIHKSSPYMPRGGYSRKNPSALVKAFSAWLENQQEPLRYNTGEQAGKRETILASGGIIEVIRVVLFGISSYLKNTPAVILNYKCALPNPVKEIPNLHFADLNADEQAAREQIEQYLTQQPETPIFVLIGDQLEEETRRRLRLLSVDKPLFFIEANNTPNHLSLAREAKLVQRVIRLLTPGIFHPRLDALSTVFIAGNADFLSIIESVHFDLKGTPSASEIELLTFILENKLPDLQKTQPTQIPPERPSFYGLGYGISAETVLPKIATRLENLLDRVIEDGSQTLNRALTAFESKAEKLSRQIASTWHDPLFDNFASIEARELLHQMIDNLDNPAWSQALQRSFLSNFIKHQPQYQPEACLVASGSSRTALGILGQHGGISEVVIPDLSWSYEQCFQKTHVVPLTATLELDVAGFIEKLDQLTKSDTSWKTRGAVVISNPHNATGRIFNEEAIRKLVAYCLHNKIYVIDDLAYQNVAPIDALPEIKTAAQIAEELVQRGILDQSQMDKLVTVHSVSKTDSFAGARLAVVEIREPNLRARFQEINAHIRPNLAAIFISYLFYRGSRQSARSYWHLRNRLFLERVQALMTAMEHLPANRNPFELTILPPKGSMYPLLQIDRLPSGLSLDWLASSLAHQGIGMLPLSTFARTEKGFETGRKTFRLTLGGKDHGEILQGKTRRLLIDLNRLIAEEDARYNRKKFAAHPSINKHNRQANLARTWDEIATQIIRQCKPQQTFGNLVSPQLDSTHLHREFLASYLPERLEVFKTRLLDRANNQAELMSKALVLSSDWLPERMHQEFMKDSLSRRQDQFKLRSYDRTVHPTQTYSLDVELTLDEIISALIKKQPVHTTTIDKAARQLAKEYLGLNVSISAKEESQEIVLDLEAVTAAEDYAELFSDHSLISMLSFWSDWDGSNRPSGQGHRLIGFIVKENVRRMAHIINTLRQVDPSIPLPPGLVLQINQLPKQNQRFSGVLNDITQLTHQLEQRYRTILPYSPTTTPWQRLAARMNIRRDPTRVLWQHNDRYERKMVELRQQRREMLEQYFALNKQLRKQLYTLIPNILENRSSEELIREVVGYRDLLQRTVITPRIHQRMITERDQFAIDTTVFNINEINTIAGKYGNPGLIMALQVSMSNDPDALISLNRKFQTQGEQMQRTQSEVNLPSIWVIPLFESVDIVESIPDYLNRVWDYATQSRHSSQTPQERFAEMISEVFIAGSDLSQQASQATAAFLYRKAKYDVQTWLAEHGVSEDVRIKLGSGEPMQRQGGYYSGVAGVRAFLNTADSKRRFARNLPAAARKSTEYAVTPLQGIFLGGDLRTYQGNLSEKLRYLPVGEFASLLYHVRETQLTYRDDLIRAAEALTESRLSVHSRSLQELERLTIGSNDDIYQGFLEELTENFRLILYGREEDVIGVHAISYFIGRSLPQLRDRPTSRKASSSGRDQSRQILANIAEIIPFSEQGSLLRAIAHNESQTFVLGLNQLTTGLFRSMERFSQKTFASYEQERIISERLLPVLPVYEILHTLRLYQDSRGEFLRKIETAFPAGNNAFVALREDIDAARRYLPLFQQELLRRHGLNVNDFFTNQVFNPDLLPTMRPELAVLLQEDFFNTDIDRMLEKVEGKIDPEWQAEVAKLLQMPEQIHTWRATIWNLIGDSIYQRVQSFSELAVALYSLSATHAAGGLPTPQKGAKLPPTLTNFFRATHSDDEMRHFLLGTMEYLNTFLEGNIEVPISIIRAINDVERIAQIEENTLPPEKQDVLRFCLLQIARLTGESG
ncbi:pyridoxal phosphate-dependent aminotransferase [bacterium]|nr:pyridoxal phosphate-dependent aminotransferase [bacterium]